MTTKYYIALIDDNDMDWCILESDDYDYLLDIFEKMSAPPGYNMELRRRDEDIDTHLFYEVLRYDHSDH